MFTARLAESSDDFLIGFALGAVVVAMAGTAGAMVYATWQVSLMGRNRDAS